MGAVRSKVSVTAPAQGPATVNVYRSNGVTLALAYTTETGSTQHSFPVTVATATTSTFWLPNGDYVVSAVIGGVEMAAGYGNTRALRVEADGWILRPESPGGGGSGSGTGDIDNAQLVALAGLASAANKLPYFTGAGTADLADFTAAGRAILDDADATAQRATLGLGTAAVVNTGTSGANVPTITIGDARYQALDADLTAIGGLTSAANKGIQFTGSGTAGLFDLTTAGKALIDDADATAQRTTLGLGTIATQASSSVAITGGSITGITDVALADGGTGASTAAAARTNLGFDETGIVDGNTLVWSTNKYIAATVLTPATVFAQAQTVNAQTGTTYTLVAGDVGKLVTLSNASGITLTLPQDSDATIAVGSYIDGMALGVGQVTVAAGSGATLRTSGLTAKSRAQYARFTVQKISANTWSLMGDLAAS